jgi:hypothetical protein
LFLFFVVGISLFNQYSKKGMAALLLGPFWDNSITDPNSAIFQWINSLLQQSEKVNFFCFLWLICSKNLFDCSFDALDEQHCIRFFWGIWTVQNWFESSLTNATHQMWPLRDTIS